MKKINDLKQLRAQTIEALNNLNDKTSTEKRAFTADEQKEYDTLRAKVDTLAEDIKRAEDLEKLNAELAGMAIRNDNDGTKKDAAKNFFQASREYIQTNGRVISNEFGGREGGLLIPAELRANPILSTANSNAISKTVANDLALVTGDNFTLLQALGVQMLPGLTGVHYLPYMAQLSTSKPTEGNDASTADASPLTVDLTPQAYSNYQTWSKQVLLTSPDSIFTGIINDMQLANERKVVADLFTELMATDTSVAATVAGLTYGDMINLTNISYNIGNAAFIVDNAIRVYLEQKAVNSNGISLAWNSLNNTVGGRKAIASDAMVSKRALYGNFGFAAVGEWGAPELIVNPYTYDSAGKLKVTVLGFYDVACRNKYAFKHFSADASCAV